MKASFSRFDVLVLKFCRWWSSLARFSPRISLSVCMSLLLKSLVMYIGLAAPNTFPSVFKEVDVTLKTNKQIMTHKDFQGDIILCSWWPSGPSALSPYVMTVSQIISRLARPNWVNQELIIRPPGVENFENSVSNWIGWERRVGCTREDYKKDSTIKKNFLYFFKSEQETRNSSKSSTSFYHFNDLLFATKPCEQSPDAFFQRS